MASVEISISAMKIKMLALYLLLLADIISNSFMEWNFRVSIPVPKSLTVYCMLVVQVILTVILIAWFFVQMWSTVLLRFGMISILLHYFKYHIITFVCYFIFFMTEKMMRHAAYKSDQLFYDDTIWDNTAYKAIFYIKNILIILFYFAIIEGSIKLSNPDFYKPQKWLK